MNARGTKTNKDRGVPELPREEQAARVLIDGLVLLSPLILRPETHGWGEKQCPRLFSCVLVDPIIQRDFSCQIPSRYRVQ